MRRSTRHLPPAPVPCATGRRTVRRAAGPLAGADLAARPHAHGVLYAATENAIMRPVTSVILEDNRITNGPYRSTVGDMHGAFLIPFNSRRLAVISSGVGDNEGWEHVSVSLKTRTPTWGEMCFIKGLFWTPDEIVLQYHPKEEDYVNHHPYCLHLWRPNDGQIPTPPSYMVGPKT